MSHNFDNFDPSHLSSVEEIKAAYEKLCKEEALIQERLEWSVGNRHHVEAKLSQLAHLVPTIQIVQDDAKKLEKTISYTCQLANNVSAKVRELDLAKGRVSDVQKRVGDLLDLEGCAGGVATALAQEDFEKAAAHIHRFLSMDEATLRHSADSVKKGASIEGWLERLHTSETKLGGIIGEQFDAAVLRGDEASIERFFKLFPLLNRHREGLDKFTSFLCAKIREKCEANINEARRSSARDKRAHVVWADTVTLLFEEIARVVEVRQPIIETYYRPGQLHIVIEKLQAECDRQASDVISAMRMHRRLVDVLSNVQQALRLGDGVKESMTGVPAARDLDTLLGELTLMSARAQLYFRFLKRRVSSDFEASLWSDTAERDQRTREFESFLARSRLAGDIAELVCSYAVLEHYYLDASLRKAAAIDAAAAEDKTTVASTGPLSSTLVDDAFYVIKKSVRRAIASNSVDGVCAILNHATDLLQRRLADTLQASLRKGFPAHGYIDLTQAYTVFQSTLPVGKVSSAAPDADTLRTAFLTCLNNAETCMRHVQSLHASLQEAVSAALAHASQTDHAKLQSCLDDLLATGERFSSVVTLGVSQLQATAIKPKVKPWVDTFGAASHVITEEELNCYESSDPFSQRLMVQLDGLLGSFAPLLTADNHRGLVAALVAEVATQLEKVVLKCTYNRLGGLQFDREMRAVASYLSQASQFGVREQLARLTQIATLLNLESLGEVSEYSSSSTWRLSQNDMRKVLLLRTDFKYEDVQRLKF